MLPDDFTHMADICAEWHSGCSMQILRFLKTDLEILVWPKTANFGPKSIFLQLAKFGLKNTKHRFRPKTG